MRDYVAVVRVGTVPVQIPVGRAEVYFYVADEAAALGADLENRVLEVWPRAEVPFPWAYHGDFAAAARAEPLGAQCRVVPDRLDMALGDGRHAAFLAFAGTWPAVGADFTRSAMRSATSGCSFR